jgi:hypothetical protein
MKKSLLVFAVLNLVLSLFSTNAFAAPEISTFQSGFPATAAYSDWLSGNNSTLDISLYNIPDEAGLPNGVYAGWCIQPRITGLLHGEQAVIYSSLAENLPPDLMDLPWDKINYVLNHKVRGEGKTDLEFFKDVQTAIWLLVGDTEPEFGVSPEAQEMIDAANANAGFTPGNGDLVALIVYSDGMSQKRSDFVQEVIIEVVFHLPSTETPLPTESATPSPTPPTSTETVTSTPPAPTETATGTLSPTETVTTTPTAPTPTVTTTPPTPTETVTPTATPPVCVPQTITVDFSGIAPGESVEGMGKVVTGLNIDAKGTAVKIQEGIQPAVYGAGVGNTVWNGGIGSGGFSDRTTQQASQPHLYTFTFAPGLSVSNFSLRMLDFGDLNPTAATSAYASMTAYNSNGFVVAKQELKFGITSYYFSPQYGNLIVTGDALRAVPGEPGNWTWNVSGSGIVKVVLEFGSGFDPNIGFDKLSYVTECSICTIPSVAVDFSGIAPGESVEGMGKVVTGLNIDAKGTAVKIQEGIQPAVYGAGVGNTVWNGGIGSGGFSDRTTQQASQPHLYTFTFAPGLSVSNFSLRMLDFGDLNPTAATSAYASMTAYNSNGFVVAKQELKFGITSYYFSPQYGNLIVTGDALRAVPGEPGNWTWNVSGSGIVKVVLEFGSGFDPNIGFDLLSYIPSCP